MMNGSVSSDHKRVHRSTLEQKTIRISIVNNTGLEDVMEKFKEMKYERPDFDAEEAAVKNYIEKLKAAQNAKELQELYLEEQRRCDGFATMQTIASIRSSIDTTDSFYEEELQQFYKRVPALVLLYQEADRIILDSPFRAEFAKGLPETLLADMEINQKLASEAIVEDMEKEAQLSQKYSKISATCSTNFRGEDCNFYQLLKYMQDTDRQTRKEAFLAWADLYRETAPELDKLYDEMVDLRIGMAKKQGFDSYIDYRYASLHRYDYTPADVKNFRNQIKEIVVPICAAEFEKQRKRLGVDKLYYYDESLFYPEGNAVPEGTPEELVAKAQRMYRELSPQTGEFFDFMVEYQLFDLVTKPGKRPGGYCTYLQSYKAPFIFSNFNGTSADVDVLTHEAGHSFAAYESGKAGIMSDYIFPNNEVAEIHSMSMELITYPWMEFFFGEKAEQYRKAHLVQALTVIPYLVCVDEFQHKVFENPQMDAGQRRNIWRELEREYMPWRDYDGHDFLEEGGFWMQKQHIFLFPFYYIEYSLAQMGAFEFYGKFQKDREAAWKDYYKLCSIGGNYGYFHTLEMANLSNPFADGTVKKIMAEVVKVLENEK